MLAKRGREITATLAKRIEDKHVDFQNGYHQVLSDELLHLMACYFAEEDDAQYRQGVAAARQDIKDYDPLFEKLRKEHADWTKDYVAPFRDSYDVFADWMDESVEDTTDDDYSIFSDYKGD